MFQMTASVPVRKICNSNLDNHRQGQILVMAISLMHRSEGRSVKRLIPSWSYLRKFLEAGCVWSVSFHSDQLLQIYVASTSGGIQLTPDIIVFTLKRPYKLCMVATSNWIPNSGESRCLCVKSEVWRLLVIDCRILFGIVIKFIVSYQIFLRNNFFVKNSDEFILTLYQNLNETSIG